MFTEVEAIQKAILFAKETGCRIHICHVACQEGVEEVLTTGPMASSSSVVKYK